MTIFLDGHDFRYAVEQSLLSYFPGDKPRYADTPDGADVISTLRTGAKWATSVTTISAHGRTVKATARAAAYGGDVHERTRKLTHCVKLSFYRAAKELTGVHPPWGSLTGIRPAKLTSMFALQGMSDAAIERHLIKRYDVTPERAALALETARASRDCSKTLAPSDIALYVGIPFCPTRCSYCSFISHDTAGSARLTAPYVEALVREMELAANTVNQLGLRVICLYMGGGTPTSLSPELLEATLAGLDKYFDLSTLREYTVEAGRPDTFTPEKMGILRLHSVDRISINPQSMNAPTLEAIGRCHSPGQVYQAYEMAVKAGFPVINMDIIAGLPTLTGWRGESGGYETSEAFLHTLESVLKLSPQNLTVHTLSRKRGSRLISDTASECQTAPVAQMMEYTLDKLPQQGYHPYYLYRQKQMAGAFENTGWCLEGFEGLYNLLIMEELSTILSIGAGGVTKLVRNSLINRRFNPKFPLEYLSAEEKIKNNLQSVIDFYQTEGI